VFFSPSYGSFFAEQSLRQALDIVGCLAGFYERVDLIGLVTFIYLLINAS
jgi:hypothetical protein